MVAAQRQLVVVVVVTVAALMVATFTILVLAGTPLLLSTSALWTVKELERRKT